MVDISLYSHIPFIAFIKKKTKKYANAQILQKNSTNARCQIVHRAPSKDFPPVYVL